MILDANRIMKERITSSLGLDKYAYIMERVDSVNVATDIDFQRKFNGFYRVRRNADWRKKYYELFEGMKTGTTDFDTIITALFEKTGNVEPSFSSKILATINPNQPVWDRYVLENLEYKLTGKSKEDRLKDAIALYAKIETRFNDFLKTDKAKDCIEVFDRTLTSYTGLTDVKKIDFFLWSNR